MLLQLQQQQQGKMHLQRIETPGLSSKMDYWLSDYYYKQRRYDYKDVNGIGKFQKFLQDNGFESEDVKEQLGEPDECKLLEFDMDENGKNMFPLDLSITGEQARKKEIYKILIWIAIYGHFPQEGKRQKLDINTLFDITGEEIDKTAAKYSRQLSFISDFTDTALKYFLAVSDKHGYPFLTYMVDSYTKDKAIKYFETG
eukprot:360064_1